jgi:hypothetical protein
VSIRHSACTVNSCEALLYIACHVENDTITKKSMQYYAIIGMQE